MGIIFQKGFFTKIMETIEQSIKQCYENKIDWRVGEENGFALIQIIFKKYTFKDKKYFIGIQCQYKSFKINFQRSDYEESKKDNDKGLKDEGFKIGVKVYEKYMENNKTVFRLNRPKSHSLISLSKKKSVDKFDIFNYSSFEALCDRLKEEIKETIPIIEEIHSMLKKSNKEFK